ncbi:MAG: adenylyltransferase/cytidyltransferase family protein [Candidatus Aenigmarchaeota archaeon]|nr:adenylyltransferase/cytidyltransferase family protein [Candidatus Aenigmarchaeota archaeon]
MVEIDFLKEAFENFNEKLLSQDFFNKPPNTGIVFLWNLHPSTSLRLTEKKGRELIFLSLKTGGFKNLTEFGRFLGEKIRQRYCPALYNLDKGKFIKLSLLIKILYYINNFKLIKNQDILELTTPKGTYRKSILNPKLPFNFNTNNGALYISSIMHDGFLNENFTAYTKKKASDEKEAFLMRKSFLDAAFNIFGQIEEPKGGWNKSLTNHTIKLPAIIALVTLCLFKRDLKKHKQNIPNFVFGNDEKFLTTFIRRCFDDDGSVYFNQKKKHRSIVLRLVNRDKKTPPPLLLGDCKLLDKVGIEYVGPKFKGIKSDSSVWQINIDNRSELIKFETKIGSDLKYKKEKLKVALSSYQQYQFPNSKASVEFLKKAYLLELRYGFFTIPELSLKCQRTYTRTARIVSKLLREGLVNKMSDRVFLGSRGRSSLIGFLPGKYSLNEKGRMKFKVVLTGGVFDIVHPGHLHLLKSAKLLGDLLIVIIARDQTAKNFKGRLPINEEKQRLAVMEEISYVDGAFLGKEESSYLKTIMWAMPDIIALGHDQKADEKALAKLLAEDGIVCKIVRIREKLGDYKTSNIIKNKKN